MASLSDHQRQKLIQEVFHCFQKSLGVIVDGRQSPQPTEDSTNRPVVRTIVCTYAKSTLLSCLFMLANVTSFCLL